jgi:hypothetical protein
MVLSNNVLYGYYSEPLGDDVDVESVTIKNTVFTGAYVGSGKGKFDAKIFSCGRQGLLVPTGSSTYPVSHLIITGQYYNNSQLSPGTYDGIELNSSTTTALTDINIDGVHAFDNQATKTQRYGALVRSGGNNTNISFNGGNLSGNLTGPMLLQDTSNTIYVNNVIGVNPQGKVDLGNITGTATFDSTKGNYFYATLTGDTTLTIPASIVEGTAITLVLQQDATGGRVLTLPANVATSTTFTLPTTANTVTTLVLAYNLGTTKWREVTRSPNALTASASATSLVDSNGNSAVSTTATASAVTGLNVTNAVSGGTVTLALTGGSNGNLIIKGQGTGIVTQRPGTDGANSIRIQNAAGSTTVLSADTSNSRIGINKTTPTATLDVNGVIASISSTLSSPTTSAGSVVTVDATQSLTNKDLSSATNTFPTFNQNTTGSAAKLTTARNIGGVAFDGSAAISLTSGTGIQKGNGSGGFTSATAGTDYLAFSGTAKISVGTSAPSSPSIGDIWIDTN